MPGTPVLIEATGLKKSYRMGRQTLEVLRGVDLEVRQGELAVIVGPSGAGKSTLLQLLGGLDRPTHGKVKFEGKELYGLRDKELSRVRNRAFGFVFQFYHLVPELTALENAMMPAWMAGGAQARGAREEARRLLRAVGLADRVGHLPSELSGGEQQRVAIARALMNRPQVVFCDEPTGNLDSVTGGKILEILLQLNKESGTALVIVTHEPAITKVAKRVHSLRDGKLWA